MSYTLVEPHPSATSRKANAAGNVTLGFSRGGAGNHMAYSPSTLSDGASASGPASISKCTRSVPRPFVGIGGAGNIRPNGSQTTFSIDEELQRLEASALAKQKQLRSDSIVHVGRGGAGNAYKDGKRRQSSATSSVSSGSSSTHSSIRRVADRLARVF